MDSTIETKQNPLPSLFASFKVIIVEWFLSTTAHALPNIFRTGNILLKMIWLCCFLACFSYCIVSVVTTINNYTTYPSYINTKIIQEIPSQFPAITICNQKTVNTTKSISYLNTNVPNLPQFIFDTTFEYIITQQYVTRSIINDDKTLTVITRKELGFKLEDMLVSCFFNYKSCSASDFTYFYDASNGNCYTFNKGVYDNGTTYDKKNVSIAGPLYGLVLELYLGDPTVDSYREFNNGVMVSIHNQSSVPFTQGEKMKAAAGTETDFIMNRNFITKLETPYGTCKYTSTSTSSTNSFYSDYIVSTLGVKYSQEYCFALCVQKQIMNTCNCSNALMPTFNGTTNFCLSDKADCLKNLIYGFGSTQAAVDCQTDCPYECETIEYGVSTYKSLFPTEFYSDILYNKIKSKGVNVSSTNIDKAFAKVNFYYKSMEYIITTQMIQTSTEDLFSNIGGTLGLYIGISILSLVEFVELGFNLVLTLIVHLKSRKQVKNNPHDQFSLNSNSFTEKVMITPIQ
jgi:hypothetical protein